MELIKINPDHYVIVDDSKIKIDDFYIDDSNTVRCAITEVESYWTHRKHYKKITHSTKPLEDVTDFLETLRYDLRTPEVFVFTPKGSVIALPSGSTPVDFAYAVHTEVGNKCVGAKVNGKLVPLESHLINGDVVEVVINKGLNAAPSHDWLNFVTSSRARSKIKAWFSKERKEEAIEAGQESIARQMRKAGLPIQKILGGHALLELAHELRYEDIESLYESVGNVISKVPLASI